MTNIQCFVRMKDYISNSTKSAIESNIDHHQPCRESMPATQNFRVLKTCGSDTEQELIEVLLIKRLKANLNIKFRYSICAKENLHVFQYTVVSVAEQQASQYQREC